MWGVLSSGQWNARNPGRKRVGGRAAGDKMWRVEEAEEGPALRVGWPPWGQGEQRLEDPQVKNFLTVFQSCQTGVGRGGL